MGQKRIKSAPPDDLSEKVRMRAYEIWEISGRPHGEHHAHWLQAERELRALSSGTKDQTGSGKAEPKPGRAKKPPAKNTAKRKT